MFDRALNPLMCINCLINDKKDISRLGKLIDEEGKYMTSAKNLHPQILIVGIIVSQMPTWNLRAAVCYNNFKMEFLVLTMATFSEVQFVKQT